MNHSLEDGETAKLEYLPCELVEMLPGIRPPGVKSLPKISLRGIFEDRRDVGRGCVFRDPPPYAFSFLQGWYLTFSAFTVLTYLFVHVKKVILYDFIDGSLYLVVLFFLTHVICRLSDSCKIRTSVVSFLNIEQKPRSELFERIKRIIERCQHVFI